MVDEPTRRATAGAPPKRADMAPTILIPTPAEMARGQRLIDAPRDQWPRAVELLADKAERAGWNVRVTYSQVLDLPAIAGRHKGERVVKHYLAVRLFHVKRQIMAYGIWSGTEDTGWKADHAQAMLVNHWPTTTFGVTELGKLVTGLMDIKGVSSAFRLTPVEVGATGI